MIEPDFLDVDDVKKIHREQLDLFGGQDGILDHGSLDGAVASARNVYLYTAGADIYDVAAAYAFAISQDQPFSDETSARA